MLRCYYDLDRLLLFLSLARKSLCFAHKSIDTIIYYKILITLKKKKSGKKRQFYKMVFIRNINQIKWVGLRRVKVSTLIYGFTKKWIAFCSNMLSDVQEEGMFCPHRAIRWQPRTILSTDTISAFLRPWRVERVSVCSPVLASGFPMWVNHSMYASGCGYDPNWGGRLKISRIWATRSPTWNNQVKIR